MTQQGESAPTGRPPAVDFRRMFKVWGLLVASMGVAALACWAALPKTTPPSGEPVALPIGGNLADLIWPDGMDDAGRKWTYIVLHHSATPEATFEAIRRYHIGRGFEGVGYHFVINNGKAPGTIDGQIIATARWLEQRAGAHALISRHPEFNREGIGICLVGNFEEEAPTPKQMAALEILVLALMEHYDIPLDHVVGHGELKNTKCPGRLFPLEAFVMDLREATIRKRLERPPTMP